MEDLLFNVGKVVTVIGVGYSAGKVTIGILKHAFKNLFYVERDIDKRVQMSFTSDEVRGMSKGEYYAGVLHVEENVPKD
jgi:hypothetical protein